jgi:RNA polymerase sigma-70 factor (ECF subfamily)
VNSFAPNSVIKTGDGKPDTRGDFAVDEAGFEAEVRKHRSFLIKIAVASTRNVADAEDIVQEALMRGHRGLASFRGDCPLRTWLARIVVRVSINHRRSFVRMVKRFTSFSDLDRENATGKSTAFDPVDPSDRFDREALLDVRKHIKRLPEEFRVPLLMLAGEGMTIPEIAAILEIPEGTVKSRIFYGRKRLKRALRL